jgi:hypothetical protein
MHNANSITKIINEKKSTQNPTKGKMTILCPRNHKEVKSSNCLKCSFCKIMRSKPVSGRTLTSLICLYDMDGSDDE